MSEADYFMMARPKRGEEVSGDMGIIKEFDRSLFVGIIDVLGSGEGAHKVAISCDDFLGDHFHQGPVDMILGLHESIMHLKRGAAVILSQLDLETGVFRFVSIGNAIVRHFDSGSSSMCPSPGLVGFSIRTPVEHCWELRAGDVLIFHTDGVSRSRSLKNYPELLEGDARTIATYVIEKFGKADDDATCIVVRYRP